METFMQALADILEVEDLKPEDRLDSFPEWDSLSVLSVIAMADAKYGVNLSAAEIRNLATPEDLYGFIAGKRSK